MWRVPRRHRLLCIDLLDADDGEADLDQWVKGDPIKNQDVVVWYGAHFTHDVTHDRPGEFGHVVGPDRQRVRW